MKLKVRTLKNDEVEIDVERSDTIHSVKNKVAEKFPSMEADRQKLIHSGKILNDEQTVGDYPSIKENDRIVVMVTKKAVPAAASSSSASAVTSAQTVAGNTSAARTGGISEPSPASTTQTLPQQIDATPTPNTTTAPTPAEPVNYDTAASALVTGRQLDECVSNICAMGFPLPQVQTAMRAAFNNPDRAVEYLMNGIPDNVVERAQPPSTSEDRPEIPSPGPGADPPIEASPQLTASGTTGGGGGNPLDTLRQYPMFDTIRAMLQSNPSLLPQVLSMIGQQNPQLLQVITENQEAFMQMLQEPVTNADEGAAMPGNIIPLNSSEMEAVQRLEALGFPRNIVLEAYLACDRNEELAGNYLFENMNDFVGGEDEEGDS